MRYSQSHKDETHTKLLKIAGRMLREKGPENLAVADVMKEAGLTHGGFYAHFKSKDALLVEAMERVFAGGRRKFQNATQGMPPRHALATYIDFYVSPRHRDDRATGCPVTALTTDSPRQSRKFRSAFNAGTQSLVGALARLIEAAGVPGDTQVLAASILSAMAGAVAISRAVSDKRLSDEMLEAARESIKARLGITDAELAKGKLQ
jgi:TetR/AcrR family transcriptional regulator, transcriptional repressor for nem operon